MIDSEQIALYAAIQENPADLAPRLIYSDWLEENDQANEALTWRGVVAKSQPVFDLYADGYGSGSGYGDGYGCEYGDGSGDGYGSGYVYGDGYGDVYGDGDKYVQKQNAWAKTHKKLIEGRPVIGKQMLIWCGRGFAWIGIVDEMYAPGCYKLSNAGMLCRTGSASWMQIAADKKRDTYVYRHAPDGIVYTGAEMHGAVEWKGELPGNDVR